MPEFEIRAIQGQAVAATITLDAGAFVGTESLKAAVGVGDNQDAILSLTPTWTAGQTSGAYTQVDLALTDAQTLALPWGVYNVQIGLDDETAALAYGWLTIYPGPGGEGAPQWRSLASPALAVAYLPNITLDQQDILPHALAAATRSIEGYCRRPLVLDSYDHFIRPQNSNRLRLKTRPVVELTRCSSGLKTAVQVQNTSATSATVNAVLSGPDSLGVSSLVFTSVVSGVSTVQTIVLASYATLTLLAAAINGLGNGWSATVPDSSDGATASSEIIGTVGARDARWSPAFLCVSDSPLSDYWLDPEQGVIEINQGFAGGGLVGNPRLERLDTRRLGIRVTYRAGYAYLKADTDLGYPVVPEDLAAACVMTASAILEAAATVGPVKSQTVNDRSYTLGDVRADIPDEAKLILARYVDVTF